jgi:hypothetical protein
MRGGGVTLVVPGRRNFPLDHRGLRRNAHVDHSGCAAMLTWITVRGGGVTMVVSGRRRVYLDRGL